jgi:tRNA modification GTPase
MPYPLDDTIVAVASPPGGAARAILRLSGPHVKACIEHLFQPDEPDALSQTTLPTVIPGALRLDEGAPPLPCDLYFWPTRRSYTGQLAAELHTFGCPPLLEAGVERLCQLGARLAEPGEFTLRAFLSGRLDLTQAEAVLGVVDAADDLQFDVALEQLAGGLGGPLGRLRDELVELLAHLEAGFDFADEDLPFITPDQLDRQLAVAAQTVAGLARQMRSRREAAEMVRAALVGWPNTGKSSLFNALAGKTGALVSAEPGTTRDYLTTELDLEGAKCLLIDTAGIEAEQGGPEEDLRRAVQAASNKQRRAADLRILCLDATRPLNPWERENLSADDPGRLLVLTKIDLVEEGDRRALPERFAAQLGGSAPVPLLFTPTSSLTGEGIDALGDRLRGAVLTVGAVGGEVVAATAVRCHESLRLAAEGLGRARHVAQSGLGEELVASEIRLVLEKLGKVVGAVYTDDILDTIFSRFCIGK